MQAIISTINTAINEGMNSPETRKAAAKLGVDLKLGTPAEAATLLGSDCPVLDRKRTARRHQGGIVRAMHSNLLAHLVSVFL